MLFLLQVSLPKLHLCVSLSLIKVEQMYKCWQHEDLLVILFLSGDRRAVSLSFFSNELQKQLFHKGSSAGDGVFAVCNSYSWALCISQDTSANLASQMMR